MKEERKSLKIQVEDGKMGGSCSWDIGEHIPREKMAGLLLDGGGHPLPLLPGGRDSDGLDANTGFEG